MSRKPEAEHEPSHERWLLSYADFVTLLLVFFIIMYSMSSLDKAKFDQLVQMLNQSFGGNKSVIAMSANGILQMNYMPSHVKTKQQKELYVKTVSELQKEIESKDVRVTADRRGIVISLSSDCYFGPGSAELSDSVNKVLSKLTTILRTLPNDIRIEGHTDNIPIVPGSSLSQKYSSNWELASQRAVNVLRIFERMGLQRDRISAASYADTRPIKPNTTLDGRNLNRRVEVVILNTPTITKLTDLDKPQEEL